MEIDKYKTALVYDWTQLSNLKHLSKRNIVKNPYFTDIEKMMLSCYYSHNYAYNSKENIFYMAIYSSNIPMIILMINNHRNNYYWPFYIRNIKIYAFLIKNMCCKREYLDDKQRNIYLIAITRGNIQLVKYLHRSNYYKKDYRGNNDVLIAAKYNQSSILSYLYKKGLSAFDAINNNEDDLFFIACRYNYPYIIEKYCPDKVANLASIKKATQYGYLCCIKSLSQISQTHMIVVFFTAAHYGKLNILKWALSQNNELIMILINGHNAFHVACMQNQHEIVIFLNETFPHLINSKNYYNENGLQLATLYNSELSLLQYLIDSGIDIKNVNIHGQSALDIAGCKNNIIIYQLLYRSEILEERRRAVLTETFGIEQRTIKCAHVINETCNICYEKNTAKFITCSNKHYVHLYCWNKCNVRHCLYCYEII